MVWPIMESRYVRRGSVGKSMKAVGLAVSQNGCWRKIAISNNVGGVKHCLSTLRPALGKERHFALVEGLRFPTKGSLAILAVRNSVRPNHLFDHNLDHDYYFELPVKGVGCPISLTVIYG